MFAAPSVFVGCKQAAISGAASNGIVNVRSESIQGYYRFAQNYLDFSNNGLNASTVGLPPNPEFVDGLINSALNLDSTSSHVSVGPSSSIEAPTLTVSLWFKTDSLLNTSGFKFYTLLSMHDGDSSQSGFIITLRKNSSASDVYFPWATIKTTSNAEVANSTQFPVAGSLSLNDGEWHHLAAIIPQAQNDTLEFYIDGQPTNYNSNISSDWTYDNFPLRFGYSEDSNWRIFSGAIDEAIIWNTRLTPAEINQVYQIQKTN